VDLKIDGFFYLDFQRIAGIRFSQALCVVYKQAYIFEHLEKKKKTLFVQQPDFPGGPKAMSQFIYHHLKYPEAAVAADVQGTVVVECDINHEGVVVDTRVLKSVGHGCDEEAVRVVRMLKFDVHKTRGLHVLFHKKINVQFKKAVPVAPAPTVQINYSYTTTPAEPKPATEQPAQQGEQTYVYTIKY